MEKYHTIYFYDLHKMNPTVSIAETIKNSFPKGKALYPFDLEGKKYTLEILEFNEHYYFGKLSRDDDYKESLTTIKNKTDHQPLAPVILFSKNLPFFTFKSTPRSRNLRICLP